MVQKPSLTAAIKIVAVAAITLILVANTWAASKEKILYTFPFACGQENGQLMAPPLVPVQNPVGGLISDSQGNLYGTTGGCGDLLAGTIYKLTHNRDGSYSHSVLYSFKGNTNGPLDGGAPEAALVFDAAGNLYGTTVAGSGVSAIIEDGTVFKLTPTKSGEWTETIIHSFNCTEGKDHNDGCIPLSSLVFDKAGNLYGTTEQGGGGDFTTDCNNGCGTVFKLSPNQDGTWTESLIHTFPHGSGGTADGQNPHSGVVFDDAGNLYGTTFNGGIKADEGLVYRLSPASNGTWKETILFEFAPAVNDPPEGRNPWAGVIVNGGNLYGTTTGGGGKVGGYGTVFKLTPTSKGEWKETVIHAFPSPRYVDGEFPYTSITADVMGNLYGETILGAGHINQFCPDSDGCGSVFKLSPNSDGTWSETILHHFSGGSDGAGPMNDTLFVDSAGNVFGTTIGFSRTPDNTVAFEITP